MAPPNIFAFKPISLAHGVGRIGAGEDEVRIGRLNGAHDRHHIGGAGRIALVVDDLETSRLGVLARAVAGRFAEFGVGANERDSSRPG
jgi:hypothetical protein